MEISHVLAEIGTQEFIHAFCDPDKFIVFCKQCNKYNACWSCPPYNFDTFSYLNRYEKAHVIGTKIILDEYIRNSLKDSEGQKEYGRQVIKEVRAGLDEWLLNLEERYPQSMAFFAGTCHRCPEGQCTRINNLPCIYPDKIRHSLESFGFDIGKTAKELLKIDLKWSNDGKLPEYFTLVSGFFSNGTSIAISFDEIVIQKSGKTNFPLFLDLIVIKYN